MATLERIFMEKFSENSEKYNKLYVKKIWLTVIFFVVAFMFFGWYIINILSPKVNPGLVVGGLCGFAAFIVVMAGIYLIINKKIETVNKNKKLLNWQYRLARESEGKTSNLPKRKSGFAIIQNRLVLRGEAFSGSN